MGNKNSRLADWLQRILIVVFASIIVLLPFHAFISTWGGTEIGPLLVWKSWKEILLIALVPLLEWFCWLRPDIATRLWRHWIVRLAALYTVLNIIFAIVSQASLEAVLAGLMMNLRFVAILLLAMLLAEVNHPWTQRIKRWAPTWLFATTILLSVMAIVQISVLPKEFLIEFGYNKDLTIAPYTLIDNNPDALRAFATMRGPNTLGSFLILPLALALVIITTQRRNMLAGVALGLGVVALVLTSARAAWLGALVALAVIIVTMVPRQVLVKAIKWGAVPAVALIGVFFWLATTVPELRLAIFHSSPGDPHLLEGSSEKHWQAVVDGTNDALNNPIGQGVGTAGPASFYNENAKPEIPENYYVQLAQEIGIFGLALFLVLSAAITYQLWRQRAGIWPRALLASFVGIAVVNLFLHGWADDPTAMIWWGLAGLYLFTEGKR